MESVGTISYCSHGGSEGLGLGGGSVFSLVRLGDRLVRWLASTTVYRRSMGYRACSMNKRSSMDKGSSTDKRGLGVGCLTVISNLSDVAIVVIGVVVDMLDPSIRKSHRVATLTHTSSII